MISQVYCKRVGAPAAKLFYHFKRYSTEEVFHSGTNTEAVAIFEVETGFLSSYRNVPQENSSCEWNNSILVLKAKEVLLRLWLIKL